MSRLPTTVNHPGHSTGDNNDCVEVVAAPAAVHVRDSKDKGGARLDFARDSWAEFVTYAAVPGATC
ncbi:DUF397 domain-containing protein [Streptomyces sp. NBC_01387]|uniref:DUF397 domain-containing protein n=1 Tax=Streptomyces sp. NBC_01387 TaxID=2903849 RepID=UPI00386B318C